MRSVRLMWVETPIAISRTTQPRAINYDSKLVPHSTHAAQTPPSCIAVCTYRVHSEFYVRSPNKEFQFTPAYGWDGV